jgi:hypothetical protein
MKLEGNQKFITGVLIVLLVASVVGNVLLYQETQKKGPQYVTQKDATSYSTVFESPGFKNEMITVFDGKQFRTYSTSTPLSENDARRMREEIEKEFERVNEFFRRQDELFRSLWNF